jgi:Fic family protein
MILFRGQNKSKNPIRYTGSLLREMFPVFESTDIKTIKSYIYELKKCLESFYPLEKYDVKSINEMMEDRFIHNSTLIENNSISKSDIKLILREDKVITNGSLREHIEIVNNKEALDFIKKCLEEERDLSRDILLNTHYLVLKTIDTKNAGVFRDKEIEIFSSDYKPAKPEEIEEKIYKYFQYYNNNKDKLDLITLSAELHGKLSFIKPFIDGNGITARLLTNYLFLREGYPIINISGTRENKIKYFQALEEFPTNPNVLYKFIAMCVFKSLHYYLKNIIPIASKNSGKYFYDKLVREFGVDKREELKSII